MHGGACLRPYNSKPSSLWGLANQASVLAGASGTFDKNDTCMCRLAVASLCSVLSMPSFTVSLVGASFMRAQGYCPQCMVPLPFSGGPCLLGPVLSGVRVWEPLAAQ